MKSRIIAFLAFLMFAIIWHLTLVRHNSLSPMTQNPDPDLQERKPAAEKNQKSIENGSNSLIKQTIVTSEKQLQLLKLCLASQNCPFPKTDPRSYELAVGQKAKAVIEQLAKTVEEQKIESPTLVQIGVEAFQWDDDHVREAALELFSTQKPSAIALNALINGLKQSHDPSIYRQAIEELHRYTEGDQRPQVDQFLMETLEKGSHFAAAEVAQDLIPFLSEKNVDSFKHLLASLDPESPRYLALKKSLDEYELR